MKLTFALLFCITYRVLCLDSISCKDENLELEELSGGASTGSAHTKLINTLWIEQPLDHFNETDNRVWNMRYFERDDMWQPGGPIIVSICGEGEADPFFLKAGMAFDLANETKGAVYVSEHRYYGKSVPVKKMQYLSSRQALADLDVLIKKLKGMSKYNDSKVVVIGGSYAGNLAVWMRLLYPHTVDAAIAISAPVLAKVDFHEYMETVGENYRTYGGNDCYNKIESMFRRYDDLLKTPEGTATLKREEGICEGSDMSNPKNQHLFSYYKAQRFRDTSMLGYPKDIEDHCHDLLDSEICSVKSLHEQYILKTPDIEPRWDENNNCTDVNLDSILTAFNYMKIYGRTNWLSSWMYQSCFEFSYARTTSSDKQPFGKNIPLSSFYTIYNAICGPEVDADVVEKSVEETNKRYGGLTPNVTKVVFLNGDMDPWHRLGVIRDLSDDAPAILIPKSSHCQPQLPTRKDDSAELINARKRAKSLVKSWIGYTEE